MRHRCLLSSQGKPTVAKSVSIGNLKLPAKPKLELLGEGWLYLAVVLDLCSRAVVGWAMAHHMRAELVNQALAMALCQRQPAAGLIMHTDRGSQYGADSYRQLLTQHGIQPSRAFRKFVISYGRLLGHGILGYREQSRDAFSRPFGKEL